MNVHRSLSKDRHDVGSLHSPKWREEEGGHRAMNFHESVPFFYTRAGAPLSFDGIYRGGHAFLVANGPSLNDLELSLLDRRWSMTLNNGARTIRGNANCTVDDPARFSLSMWLDPNLMKFIPMAQFEKPLWDNRLIRSNGGWCQRWEMSNIRVGDCPNVVGFRRNEKYHAPRWLSEETINWGNHTKYGGGRSVMLAALRILFILGFRQVYLLGVDFEMSETKKYHFPEQRTAASIKGNMSTYAKLQRWFGELQPYFLKAGFNVMNCNEKSRLKAFPRIPYLEAIERSGADLGNILRERTEGMYQNVEDRVAKVKGERADGSTFDKVKLSKGSANEKTAKIRT